MLLLLKAGLVQSRKNQRFNRRSAGRPGAKRLPTLAGEQFVTEGLWLDAAPDQRDKLKVGDRFEISNPDKPAWCNGWFEVEEFLIEVPMICKRVEPSK